MRPHGETPLKQSMYVQFWYWVWIFGKANFNFFFLTSLVRKKLSGSWTKWRPTMYHSSLLFFSSAEDSRMSTAKLFLLAMAIAAVFFVDVNARVAAHYNNHEVSCHSRK